MNSSLPRSHISNLVLPAESKPTFDSPTVLHKRAVRDGASNPANSFDNFSTVTGMQLPEHHQAQRMGLSFITTYPSSSYYTSSNAVPVHPVGIPSSELVDAARSRRHHAQEEHYHQHHRERPTHSKDQLHPAAHHRQSFHSTLRRATETSISPISTSKTSVPKRDRAGILAVHGSARPANPLHAKKIVKKTLTSSSAAPQKKVRSSKSNIPGTSRYWTPSEHKLFVLALLKYGPKDLKSIAAYVGTRNMIQCRTHEQKCFMRLMREAQRETELRAEGASHSVEADPVVGGSSMSSASSSVAGPAAAPADRLMSSAASSVTSEIPVNPGSQNGMPASKQAKDVYSVSPSCGITLLCVVGEEMSRALSC